MNIIMIKKKNVIKNNQSLFIPTLVGMNSES